MPFSLVLSPKSWENEPTATMNFPTLPGNKQHIFLALVTACAAFQHSTKCLLFIVISTAWSILPRSNVWIMLVILHKMFKVFQQTLQQNPLNLMKLTSTYNLSLKACWAVMVFKRSWLCKENILLFYWNVHSFDIYSVRVLEKNKIC